MLIRQILLKVCPPAKFVPSGTVTSATYAASLAHVLLALLLDEDAEGAVGTGINETVGATVGTSDETFP